ncbi:MAG: tRNA lysidine(34) synthetase TilS [Clostridia bacterium]|nr:tRNA lysidine(34) synthetase TilS [Clostridia bacterium]
MNKLQRILGCVRNAVDTYNMIEEGDKIAVGVSGGKDSVLLLKALCGLRVFYPKNFEIVAITLDMRFNNEDGDFSEILKLCNEYNVRYEIKRTELFDIIFNVRKESNPCSLCSRMRRGILHDTAKEFGCNKIALGHHKDDAAETFLMNLLSESRIGCFAPVTYLSRKDITMIRPLINLTENDVEAAVTRLSLPVVKSSCPANENTRREDIKKLIKELDKEYEDAAQKIIGAMKRSHIDNW